MLGNYVISFLRPTLANPFKTPVRNFMPRRALLYVPGSDLRKILKAFLLDIDCIILDCEDAVSLNRKAQARTNITKMLKEGKPAKKRRYDFVVRVNSVSSGILKDDLSVILAGKHLPDTFILPKVESSDDLQLFSDYLDEFLKTKSKLGLILGLESPQSLVNIVDICRSATKMAETSQFTPAALLFGSDDFCVTMGAKKSKSSSEVMYARQKLLTVAKAFDLQAIDMVYSDYKDLEGLKQHAEEAARMGYIGKQIVHPLQVEITQTAFTPTNKAIKWANDILHIFNKHEQEGTGGFFLHKGELVHMPMVRQAQNIIELANAIMLQK